MRLSSDRLNDATGLCEIPVLVTSRYRKRLEPLHAAKQIARAVFSAACEFGAAQIAGHERVPCQDEPAVHIWMVWSSMNLPI